MELIQDVWGDDSSILLDPALGLYIAIGDRRITCCGICCSLCSIISKFRRSENFLNENGQQTGNMEGAGVACLKVWLR